MKYDLIAYHLKQYKAKDIVIKIGYAEYNINRSGTRTNAIFIYDCMLGSIFLFPDDSIETSINVHQARRSIDILISGLCTQFIIE